MYVESQHMSGDEKKPSGKDVGLQIDKKLSKFYMVSKCK